MFHSFKGILSQGNLPSDILFNCTLMICIVLGSGLIGLQIWLKTKDRLPNLKGFLTILTGLIIWNEILKYANIFLFHVSDPIYNLHLWQDIGIIGLLGINYVLKWWREPHDIPNIPLKKPNKSDFEQGTIKLGTIFHDKKLYRRFFLNKEDLKRHTLIYGQTGTGKTSFLKNFLIHFKHQNPSLPVLLFEFKGEYTDLHQKLPNMEVIHPGLNFAFNLFDHDIFTPEIYVEILFDSLKSCRIIENATDFSPQMEKVLIDVLKEICHDPSNHSWERFNQVLDAYVRRNQIKIPMLPQTMISIKNRLRRYTEGPLGQIFDFSPSARKLSNLLCRDCIVDLSSVLKLGGSKEDLIFMANLILKWIWEKNMQKPPTDQLQHLTIFEDVSYLSSRKLLETSKLSSYLEDIALLLRGKGEALISITTTLDISKNIILNAGSKFFFKFNEKPEEMIHYLGLPHDFRLNINELRVGYCVAKIDSIPYVFLLKSPKYRGNSNLRKKMLSREKKKKQKTNPMKKFPAMIKKNETHDNSPIPKTNLDATLLHKPKKQVIKKDVPKKEVPIPKKKSFKRESKSRILTEKEIINDLYSTTKNLEDFYLTNNAKAMNENLGRIIEEIQVLKEKNSKNVVEEIPKIDRFVSMYQTLNEISNFLETPDQYLESLWYLHNYWETHIWMKIYQRSEITSKSGESQSHPPTKILNATKKNKKIKTGFNIDYHNHGLEDKFSVIPKRTMPERTPPIHQQEKLFQSRQLPSILPSEFSYTRDKPKNLISIAIFHFNEISGPLLFYDIGEQNITPELELHLGKYLDKMTQNFEVVIENYYCDIKILEIESEWSRSGKELLEIVMFGENSAEIKKRIHSSKIQQEMVKVGTFFKHTSNIYQAFYLQDPQFMESHKDEIKAKSKEFKNYILNIGKKINVNDPIYPRLAENRKTMANLEQPDIHKLNQYITILLQKEC